jgi:hypothetical protein
MHNISRKYLIKYFYILKAQKLKRTKEDTRKIMEWEEMYRKCQNLGRIPWEKHTTCHDKSIKKKIQGYVAGWERKWKKSTCKDRVRTWYTLVRTVHCQISNRKDCACSNVALNYPDIRVDPSGRFTLKIWNWRKICRQNIFPKNSFRTRMYNQLIKQSNIISKICKDIIES